MATKKRTATISFDSGLGNKLRITFPEIEQVKDYPQVRITKQKTGNKVSQKIIGNYGGKLQYVEVDTYKVLVIDESDPNFKFEFSVARDAFAVIPGDDKGAKMVLSNMSFEPKNAKINHYTGKYMPSYPNNNDTPAIKLYQKKSEVIHAEARPDALLIKPKPYRYKADVASGIMIHVGGNYLNEKYGDSISASEGCFGIVNDNNSINKKSDKLTIEVINKIWKQAKKSKSNPEHIRVIIEKRDETKIPNKIIFTKK